jgi:arylsulfatase A-like enzyme
VGAVTSGIDVMPTILEVAGVEGPEAMQGRSLVGLWEGRDLPPRTAFSESTFYAEEIKSVRGPRYKLIFEIGPDTVAEHGRHFVPADPDRRRLFDLESDPGEHRDLLEAPSERAAEIAAGLEAELRSHAASTPGEVEEIELDEEAIERLKAMGYVQ